MSHDHSHPSDGGCKRPVGHVHVRPCYPTKDACGGDVVGIKGAWVEMKRPGCDAWLRVGYVPITQDFGNFTVDEDGDYLFRTIATTGCVDSAPSDPEVVAVDLTPPAKPPKPEIMVPCPQ